MVNEPRDERPAPTPRRVVAVVPDLFFAARISATASRLGVAVEMAGVADAEEVIHRAAPQLVIIDLHAPGDPLGLIRALRADPLTRVLRVIGFYAHVEHDLRLAALAAGLDEALPRSAFTARLPAILGGEGAPR